MLLPGSHTSSAPLHCHIHGKSVTGNKGEDRNATFFSPSVLSCSLSRSSCSPVQRLFALTVSSLHLCLSGPSTSTQRPGEGDIFGLHWSQGASLPSNLLLFALVSSILTVKFTGVGFVLTRPQLTPVSIFQTRSFLRQIRSLINIYATQIRRTPSSSPCPQKLLEGVRGEERAVGTHALSGGERRPCTDNPRLGGGACSDWIVGLGPLVGAS